MEKGKGTITNSCHLDGSPKMGFLAVSRCEARKTINSPEKRNNLQPSRDGILSKDSFAASYKNVRRGTSCRQKLRGGYWCKTMDDRYYCCPSGKSESWMEYVWYNFLYPLLWTNAEESPSFHLPWREVYIEKEIETKKHCPPLRTHCPRSYDWYMPPISCDEDEDCHEWEKCCYDVCLEHKICKHVSEEEEGEEEGNI
nr:uncharacterized protein LOC117607916 [Osmia lignaria]